MLQEPLLKNEASQSASTTKFISIFTMLIIISHCIMIISDHNTRTLFALCVWVIQVFGLIWTICIVPTKLWVPKATNNPAEMINIVLVLSYGLIIVPAFHFGLGFSLIFLDIYLLLTFTVLGISYFILQGIQYIIERFVRCYTHSMTNIDFENKCCQMKTCKSNMIVTRMELKLDNDIKYLEKSITIGKHSIGRERLKSQMAALVLVVIVTACLLCFLDCDILGQIDFMTIGTRSRDWMYYMHEHEKCLSFPC